MKEFIISSNIFDNRRCMWAQILQEAGRLCISSLRVSCSAVTSAEALTEECQAWPSQASASGPVPACSCWPVLWCLCVHACMSVHLHPCVANTRDNLYVCCSSCYRWLLPCITPPPTTPSSATHKVVYVVMTDCVGKHNQLHLVLGMVCACACINALACP